MSSLASGANNVPTISIDMNDAAIRVELVDEWDPEAVAGGLLAKPGASACLEKTIEPPVDMARNSGRKVSAIKHVVRAVGITEHPDRTRLAKVGYVRMGVEDSCKYRRPRPACAQQYYGSSNFRMVLHLPHPLSAYRISVSEGFG